MKRLAVILLGILVVGVVGLGNPVPASDGPPLGLPPRAYACYETCVLPNYIVADDFDMNGWLDLAVSCVGNNVVGVHTNANGIFALAPLIIAVGPGPTALTTGHIGVFDGFPDIGVLSTLTAGSGVPPVEQIPNGAGPAVGIPLGGLPANNLVHMVGDYFDNNNLLDIAVVETGPNLLYVYDDAGNLLTPGGAPIALPGPPVFVCTADFDQNGWADIAVLCAGNPASVAVYYNNGAIAAVARFGVGVISALGTGLTITALWAPLVPTGMDVGDFNDDGYPDLVVVGNAGAPPQGFAQVLLNTVPTPTVSAIGLAAVYPAMQTWGFNTRFVEVADFDGNERDDFATANYDSDTVTIFLTDALGLVQDHRPVDPNYCLCPEQRKKDLLDIAFKLFKIELRCGHFPISLAAGDFDRNGKMDLAVALQSADEELCAQNNSCIEIDFDIACGFNKNQRTHQQILVDRGLQDKEKQQCPECKEEPCAGNVPPKAEIQTESETKNQ